MKKSLIALIVVVILGLILLSQATFIVDQTEKALKLQLGKPVAGPLEPGLHFKKPFIQNVIYFDARLLDYDARPAEILTRDKKNMVVDNYSRWRIVDPLQFYRTVRTIPGAQSRLDDIIYAELRVALGNFSLIEVVSKKRNEIMRRVTAKADELVQPYGIEVVDVRIKRTDLPPENERAIFGRMRAEREREAKQYRSEGREAAARITADADKQRTILLANADKEAATLRGQGDAEAVKIYAKSLGQDPEFYEFQRSLEAYQKAFRNDSQMVLSPDMPFFKYLK